jgi:hypothetical protein
MVSMLMEHVIVGLEASTNILYTISLAIAKPGVEEIERSWDIDSGRLTLLFSLDI